MRRIVSSSAGKEWVPVVEGAEIRAWENGPWLLVWGVLSHHAEMVSDNHQFSASAATAGDALVWAEALAAREEP